MLRAEDFRLATRRLRRSIGTTVASVLALACGIGAAAATWSLLSSVLIKPLPVRDPDRLFVVEAQLPPLPDGMQWRAALAYPDFEAIASSDAFESIAAGGDVSTFVTEQGDIPRQRSIYFANHEFFSTLGVGMALGRAFAVDDDIQGAPPVAVLSHAYWRSVFSEDPNVLGRSVRIGEVSVTIVGVLQSEFRGLSLSRAPDIYMPLHTVDDLDLASDVNRLGRGFAWLDVVGRLRDGETQEVAATRVNVSRLDQRQYVLRDINTAAVPEVARASLTQFTTLLSLTVGFLVLIGSVTVGMLLLVRTEDRRDELSVCLALGATRARLAAGIAAEASILSQLGAVLAIPVTWAFYSGVRAFQLPGSIDIRLLTLSFDVRAWLAITAAALIATCAIALLAGLIGLAGHGTPLHSRTVTTPQRTRRMLRATLVGGQIAITLVLVAGAGLFARSLTTALNLNAHVDSARIVTASMWLGSYGYTPERASSFLDELLERLRANGTIESVSIAQDAGGIGPPGRIMIDGAEREMSSFLWYSEVDESYFSTLGLPVLDGRGFTSADTAGVPLVAIVSQSFGRLIAGDASPVGHRITVRVGGDSTEAEVIGVVPDVITDIDMTEPLSMYYALAQRSRSPNTRLVIRAAGGNTRAAMRELAAVIESIDPRVTPAQMSTLDEEIGRQMNAQRFGMYVLGTLGGIALLLTVLGTYVVAESMVVRRRREMSIRAALGAGASRLRGQLLADTARVVGIGIVGGLLLSVLCARLIRSLLYQVEPLDPRVLGTVSAIIFGLALLVSLRPALEVTRFDLARSLREE